MAKNQIHHSSETMCRAIGPINMVTMDLSLAEITAFIVECSRRSTFFFVVRLKNYSVAYLGSAQIQFTTETFLPRYIFIPYYCYHTIA